MMVVFAMTFKLKLNTTFLVTMFPVTSILHFLAIFLLSLSFTGYAYAEINIPRSEISSAAYQRLAPQLEQEMQNKNLHLGQPIFIRIFKEENELEIWVKKDLTYELFKTYTICKYSGELGPKLKEGDGQSPEGFYTVSVTALNPWSDFHLSFNLGYPNEFDRLHKRTGGALMVHGKCASVGCFAMNDFRIEEIYTIVDASLSAGQEKLPVHIFPFRMTWDKMAQNVNSPWIPFWENLKQGYDFFLGHRAPPEVTVEGQQYAFHTSRPLLFGSDLSPVQAMRTPDEKKIAEVRIKPSNEKKYAEVMKKRSKNRRAL
ncbi:MAG: murein L,D-transpeptidase [Desulfocapsaceae bacterium]|nr:murein L,D-transpeptidase [Desulfocapsaceae bacterium]